MKTKDEIQKAHDILTAFILGEVPMPKEATARDRVSWMSLTAGLCWVIGDGHPPAVEVDRILAEMMRHAEEEGFRLEP